MNKSITTSDQRGLLRYSQEQKKTMEELIDQKYFVKSILYDPMRHSSTSARIASGNGCEVV